MTTTKPQQIKNRGALPQLDKGYLWKKSTGFPGSSADKESACNVRDTGLIPGSGRSAGEWIDYPLQCSWASLVTQMVKNLPARQDTRVRSLGWKKPLAKGMATHSSILAWRIPRTEEAGRLQSMVSQTVRHDWVTCNFRQGYGLPW